MPLLLLVVGPLMISSLLTSQIRLPVKTTNSNGRAQRGLKHQRKRKALKGVIIFFSSRLFKAKTKVAPTTIITSYYFKRTGTGLGIYILKQQ